jgi:hypothetical protein
MSRQPNLNHRNGEFQDNKAIALGSSSDARGTMGWRESTRSVLVILKNQSLFRYGLRLLVIQLVLIDSEICALRAAYMVQLSISA